MWLIAILACDPRPRTPDLDLEPCDYQPTPVSADDDRVGFSADEVAAFAAGPRTGTLRWFEGGEEAAATETPLTFELVDFSLDSVAAYSDPSDVGCESYLEMPATLLVQTADGALDVEVADVALIGRLDSWGVSWADGDLDFPGSESLPAGRLTSNGHLTNDGGSMGSLFIDGGPVANFGS